MPFEPKPYSKSDLQLNQHIESWWSIYLTRQPGNQFISNINLFIYPLNCDYIGVNHSFTSSFFGESFICTFSDFG